MSSPIPPATVAIPPTTQPDLPPLVLPHFRCSSRPGGSGQGFEVPRLCRFIHRPDHELAAGEEPAPNFLHFQPDHGSRTVPAAPKVRENQTLCSIMGMAPEPFPPSVGDEHQVYQ